MIPAHHCTLFAFVCIDGSLQIFLIFSLHDCHHFLFFSFEIPVKVHDSLFDLVFTGSIFVCTFLLDYCMMILGPRWVWRSWTLLLRIWTLSASSSGPSPECGMTYLSCSFLVPFKIIKYNSENYLWGIYRKI
jgi:hypothetical protein